MLTVPLLTLAHGRSGDKGNHANIAVIAYTAPGYEYLKEQLTAERVRLYLAAWNPTRVERYECANVLGLNFVLFDALAGGASRSLRTDTQGKTLASVLLQMPIEVPDDWQSMGRKESSP